MNLRHHLSRFRVTYLTASVAVAAAVGAEFTVLKDMPVDQLHGKTWAFWVSLVAAVVVNAGNTILAALHPSPSETNENKTTGNSNTPPAGPAI